MLDCTFAQLIFKDEGNEPATNSTIETFFQNQIKSCEAWL